MFDLVNLTDILGSLLAFTTTILYAKNNPWSWRLCIITNFVHLYLYSQKGIYAHAFLEIIYICLAVYGLYNWLYGGKHKTPSPVTRLPYFEALFLLMLAIIGYLIVNNMLVLYTSSTISRLDALTMVLCLIGQWMAARRYIENWLLWLVVDILMAIIFYQKNLSAHFILNIFYLPIALYGYTSWSKILISRSTYHHPDHYNSITNQF